MHVVIWYLCGFLGNISNQSLNVGAILGPYLSSDNKNLIDLIKYKTIDQLLIILMHDVITCVKLLQAFYRTKPMGSNLREKMF